MTCKFIADHQQCQPLQYWVWKSRSRTEELQLITQPPPCWRSSLQLRSHLPWIGSDSACEKKRLKLIQKQAIIGLTIVARKIAIPVKGRVRKSKIPKTVANITDIVRKSWGQRLQGRVGGCMDPAAAACVETPSLWLWGCEVLPPLSLSYARK